ncbi:MAG: hypothetical protein EBY24_15265 [Betaproteobacteria bacterium]|nr:hypothetical protein [Betaproteobacteria bacterium]
MLYELRIYHPMPGRLDDLVERIGAVMPPFFERHGFAPRLGQWVGVAGSPTPVFAWLLRWPSLERRMAAFAALGADEEWNAVRVRTNGPGEMVRRYNLRLLSPSPAAAPVDAEARGPACGLYEVRVLPVAVGRTRAAAEALAAVDLPALAATGTTIVGVFDNVFGGATPGVTLLLGWPDFERRREALANYERQPEVARARRSERQQYAGEHLLGMASSLLLEPARYGAIDLQTQQSPGKNP